MVRSILAVVAGLLPVGIVLLATDVIVWVFFPDFSGSASAVPTRYLVMSAIAIPAWSCLGGYWCARVARRFPSRHVWALMLLGELGAVASAVWGWDSQPHWYGVAILLLYPPAVWLGGWLRRWQMAPA